MKMNQHKKNKQSIIEEDNFLNIYTVIIVMYIGYFVGRVGHMMGVFYNGYGPHHWLFGYFILVVFFPIFVDTKYGKYLYCFGLGLFISDFNDFWTGNWIMPDNVTQFNFWGFD